MTPPRKFSALPPAGICRASPKAISGRTSYLRVRLEFLPYPHLIPALFNGRGFGPPPPFTAASAWTRVGHPVSGPRCLTLLPAAPAVRSSRLLSLRLRQSTGLTSPDTVARRTVLQKVHGRIFHAPTACGRGVSGSLSLPSRGPFHLSLTVLCSIGRWVVFSLAGWSPLLPTGFHVSRGTLVLPHPFRLSPTGLSPSPAGLSSTVLLGFMVCCGSPYPGVLAHRFGLLPVRSPLLGESMFLSFPPAT